MSGPGLACDSGGCGGSSMVERREHTVPTGGSLKSVLNMYVFIQSHFSLAKDKSFCTMVSHTISTAVKNSGVGLPRFKHASLLNLLGASFLTSLYLFLYL